MQPHSRLISFTLKHLINSSYVSSLSGRLFFTLNKDASYSLTFLHGATTSFHYISIISFIDICGSIYGSNNPSQNMLRLQKKKKKKKKRRINLFLVPHPPSSMLPRERTYKQH